MLVATNNDNDCFGIEFVKSKCNYGYAFQHPKLPRLAVFKSTLMVHNHYVTNIA